MSTIKDGVDYAALAQFRRQLRRFLAFSESAAASEGLTGQQHQALLAIRGLSRDGELSVGELAEILLLRHHSAVELANRLVKLGLIERTVDPADARRVLLHLTPTGETKLQALSTAHQKELAAIGPALTQMLLPFHRAKSS
jgi:DNA-binding MarR family transcriptional regulator